MSDSFPPPVATPSPYLGQVAGNGLAAFFVDASLKQANTREMHYARDDITSLQIAFSNYYGAESAPGAPLTIRAAIEYPANTFTLVYWSSVRDLIIANGLLGPLSDAFSVVIPRGAMFWVNNFAQCTSGVVYLTRPSSTPSLYSTGAFSGSGQTDLTTSTAARSPDQNWHPCTLIVGTTTRASVLGLGDSETYGVNENIMDQSQDMGLLARSIGPAFANLIVGNPGETLAGFLGSAGVQRRKIIPYFSHLINAYGRNDLGVSTAAQIIANMNAFAALKSVSQKVITCTVTPKSASTDSWATTTNQTTDSTNADRITVNQTIRANGIVGCETFFDSSPAWETLPDSGIWVPGYTTDGLHGSSTANITLRDQRRIDSNKVRR